MKAFYRVLAGPPNIPLMTEIMRSGVDTLPAEGKRMALAIMQVTNGTALLDAKLMRIDHDQKQVLPKAESGHYLAVLSGQIMCMIGEECPALNAGEVWWLDPKEEPLLINKSGDDVVLLYVAVKVD